MYVHFVCDDFLADVENLKRERDELIKTCEGMKKDYEEEMERLEGENKQLKEMVRDLRETKGLQDNKISSLEDELKKLKGKLLHHQS